MPGRKKHETPDEHRERCRLYFRAYNKLHPYATYSKAYKLRRIARNKALKSKNVERYKQYELRSMRKQVQKRLAAGLPKWIKQTHEYMRARSLKHQFGMSLQDYAALLEKQHGCCAICGKPPSKRNLAVDHCHDTKKVRGLLCCVCNLMLGHARNDTNILERAVEYLNRVPEQARSPR